MCLFGVVPYFDKSDLSEYICHILSVHEVISVANHNHFGGSVYYKMDRYLT